MAKYAAAIDQGTTSTRCMVFDHGGNVVSVAQKEHEQIYPKPGWVEHDVEEIWARTQEVVDEAMALGRRERGRRRRRRHHQPARDVGRVGPDDRQADPQRARLAGHPDGQARRRVLGGRRPGALPGEGRAPARDVLLRAEDPLAARQRRGRGGEGRVGRPAVRQHGHLADLEPDRRHRRRAAHHRRHQREPHDADGPADARLGRRGHGRHGRPARDAAGDQGVQRGLRRGQVGRARGRADRRRPRRPAGGDVRPDVLLARRGEEHVRHGQLPAAQHRHGGGAVEERPADHGRLQDRRPGRDLLPRGRDRDHGRARAVAARQPAR